MKHHITRIVLAIGLIAMLTGCASSTIVRHPFAFEKETNTVVRKVPILGSIPVLGVLFMSVQEVEQ